MEQIGSRNYVRQGGSVDRRPPRSEINPIRAELAQLCENLRQFNIRHPKMEIGGRSYLTPELKSEHSSMVERIKLLRFMQAQAQR